MAIEINDPNYDSLLDSNEPQEGNKFEDFTPAEPAENLIENQPDPTESPLNNGGEEAGNPKDNDNNDDDVITMYLKNSGIQDPSKIKYENESGEIEDVDFNSLSKNEQLNILTNLGKDAATPQLTTDEINTINYLRQNNINLNQAIDYFSEQRLNEYLNNNPDKVHQKSYEIDDYSDDELYLADLKSKYPSFSDEELVSKLNTAKENEDLFNKEVGVLRDNYKANEDQEIQNQQLREQQDYQDFQNNLINIASQFNSVPLDYNDPKTDMLEVEDADKNKMLAYLLNQDQDGQSQFVKDIQDPRILLELAYFRTQGLDALANVTRYWKDVVKSDRKKIASLEKKLGINHSESNTVVVSNKKSNNNQSQKSTSVWDNTDLI